MKTCNHQPKKIFSHDGVNYYSSDEDNAISFDGDLVVNLTQSPGIRTLSGAYDIPALSPHLIQLPPEIVLGWIDMSRPPVKSSFWTALHLYCKNNKYKDVLFHCEHGHGRTGTALCAMLTALKHTSIKTAIEEVRESHCQFAVESEKQIEYLLLLDNELNGRLLPEEEEDLEKLVDSLLPPRLINRSLKG